MLGDELFYIYRIVQNNCFDPSTQVYLGRTSQDHEIWINQEFYQCDVKILTGFIEPHLFAGFSGAGKAIMPGMAGQKTVLGNHSYPMIAHPQATWGITHGNPIWEEIQEVAHRVGADFLLNVALNREKAISRVFSGDLDAAHAAGCQSVRQTAMIPVKEPFDIVVTTNSGYPLDLNLYQSVKGMSAAAQVVRPGGAIIIAAECWDGVPEHGLYGQLLREAESIPSLLEAIQPIRHYSAGSVAGTDPGPNSTQSQGFRAQPTYLSPETDRTGQTEPLCFHRDYPRGLAQRIRAGRSHLRHA